MQTSGLLHHLSWQWNKSKITTHQRSEATVPCLRQTDWPGLAWPNMTIHISYAHLKGQTSAFHFLFLQWPHPWAVASTDTPLASVFGCHETLDRKQCYHPTVLSTPTCFCWMKESSLMFPFQWTWKDADVRYLVLNDSIQWRICTQRYTHCTHTSKKRTHSVNGKNYTFPWSCLFVLKSRLAPLTPATRAGLQVVRRVTHHTTIILVLTPSHKMWKWKCQMQFSKRLAYAYVYF